MRWNREVDRAIISGVTEAEIQQIKQEYITERIKESIDLFGGRPELFSSIITTAVSVLALLISKVLEKAREMSTKVIQTEPRQEIQSEPQMQQITDAKAPQPQINEPQTENPPKRKIPPKPIIPADAGAYPKLLKIYKELNRQNEIIFDAEKERNGLEVERDNLKGIAKLTKKSELQNRINLKNESIDILKTGLSGIVRRYGFQNVQDFYRTYHKAHSAYAEYQDKVTKWEEIYGI